MLGEQVDKFQDGTLLTSQVMDCLVYVIGKAIKPLLAEPVTYYGVYCYFQQALHLHCALVVLYFIAQFLCK